MGTSTRLCFGSILLWAILLLFGPSAVAQFASPVQSSIRERLAGELLSEADAPTPEAGDQLAVFAGEKIVGLHTFTSGQTERLFDIRVYGDDPDTTESEGPAVGGALQFRFYDSSTNAFLTNVVALNDDGETFNLTFEGQFVVQLPGVPIDLTPSREIDARLNTEQGGTGSGGNGGGGGTTAGEMDINSDGVVNRDDAALVLRAVVGGRLTEGQANLADVDGDGVVTTRDAIAILRGI